MTGSFQLDILSPDFINKIPLIVAGYTPDGNLLYWNKQARTVTGFNKSDAAKDGFDLIGRLFPGNIRNIISGRSRLSNRESAITTKSGDTRHIVWNSYVIDSSKGQGTVVVLTGQDITFRRLLQKTIDVQEGYIRSTNDKLKKYVSLDPHTGLLNYKHFMQKLDSVFTRSVEEQIPVSLLIIDIDYFCSINNIHGVSKGNRILRKLAALIKKHMGKDHIIARFSGTEFAILMPGVDNSAAFTKAGGLFSTINDHNFGIRDLNLNINLSLYMALGGYPYCEDVFTPQQLLDRVTAKLREAKTLGGNSILLCSPNEMKERKAEEPIGEQGSLEYKYTMEFVHALANTVKTKDYYTQEHSAIMSNYAVHIAEHMGLCKDDIRNVRYGSLLHDIGKIGIDKFILLKPRSLTRAEFSLIKQHPRIGAEIIRNVHPLKDVVPLVLYHHERFDGTGYPNGLKREEIPLGARIISLADVFQALTSDRPYRKALSEKEAFDIIKSYSGSFFDPDIVSSFFSVYRSC